MQGTIWCTNFNLQIGFIKQVTVLPYKQDYLVYNFGYSNRLHTTSNSITVRKGLFGVDLQTGFAQQVTVPHNSTKRTIWCTNFNLQIGFIGQVTVLPYAGDFFVYKFCSSNRLHRTINRITVCRELFGVQISIFK
jgi:hypothetical protein